MPHHGAYPHGHGAGRAGMWPVPVVYDATAYVVPDGYVMGSDGALVPIRTDDSQPFASDMRAVLYGQRSQFAGIRNPHTLMP